MRPKSLLLLALALGCGLIASIGISQVMESKKQGPAGVEKRAIYIAGVNINTGDPISTEMVILKEWPKSDIPAGAITELAALEDRRPRTPIFQGEPILESKLLNPGEKGSDPTQHIPKGFRIVPIPVGAATGAAGLLRPGDRVDVQWYVARNPRIGVQETTTKTILHNIRVFAVDQRLTRPASGDEAPTMAKTISLLVTPEQANKVRLAGKIGEVSLIPRHPDDPAAELDATVSFDDLVEPSESSSRALEQGRAPGEASPPEGGFFAGIMKNIATGAAASAAAQVQPPFEMEVVLGSKLETQLFDAASGKPLRQAGDFGAHAGAGGPVDGPSGRGNTGLPLDESPITVEEFPGDPQEAQEVVEALLDSESDFPIDFSSDELELN